MSGAAVNALVVIYITSILVITYKPGMLAMKSFH